MNHIFFLISLGVLAGACSRSAQVAGTEEPGMFLTDSLKRVVSVDTVRYRPVADELTLTGRVAFNPEKGGAGLSYIRRDGRGSTGRNRGLRAPGRRVGRHP